MRKFRIFQNDKYLSLDLLNKEAQIISLSDEPVENAMTLESKKGKKYLTMESPEMTENNAIKDELNDFYYSIINDLPTKVSIEDGLKSLKMAEMIQDSIFENHKKAIQ
jgi:predicted dehydrogenase